MDSSWLRDQVIVRYDGLAPPVGAPSLTSGVSCGAGLLASLPRPGWLFEPKYDGYRGLLYVTRHGCYFRSKRGNIL
jgi:ATP-dependent DNA ligase